MDLPFTKQHLEVTWRLKLLLDLGANVNAKRGYNGTALQQAASGGHLEVVRLLLDHGANINAKEAIDGSALHKAAFGGHLEVVKLLLDLGVNVNAEGGYDGTALQQAASGGHLKVVRLLLDHGANINGCPSRSSNAKEANVNAKREMDLLVVTSQWSQYKASRGHLERLLSYCWILEPM
jgi:ankyrin repeat protein